MGPYREDHLPLSAFTFAGQGEFEQFLRSGTGNGSKEKGMLSDGFRFKTEDLERFEEITPEPILAIGHPLVERGSSSWSSNGWAWCGAIKY